jgi:hypothetical protein
MRLTAQYVVHYNQLEKNVLDSIRQFQLFAYNNRQKYENKFGFHKTGANETLFKSTNSTESYGDKILNKYNAYFDKEICPAMKFFFFEKDLTSNNVEASKKKFYYLASTKEFLNGEHVISYYFDDELKLMQIMVEFTLPTRLALTNHFTSLYSCKGGYIFLDASARRYKANEKLVGFEFACGPGYYDRYGCAINSCNKRRLCFTNDIGMTSEEAQYCYISIDDLIHGRECK